MTQDFLHKIVNGSVENGFVDFKGPCQWDESVESAKLARHIYAFANSPGGGFLVIGRSETSPGTWEMRGLSEEQRRTFETARVARWVNARCEPSVRLECISTTIDGKSIVVIQVFEFDDVPILCTKRYEPELRTGLYCRTEGGESSPLQTASELRRLVGIAVTKQQDQFLARLQGLLQGKSPDVDESATDRVAHDIDGWLQTKTGASSETGFWRMSFTPADATARLFTTTREATTLLGQARSRWFGWEFPGLFGEPTGQPWGCSCLEEGGAWGLSWEGVFDSMTVRIEERQSAPPGTMVRGGLQRDWDATSYVSFQWAISAICSRANFAAKFASCFDPDARVSLSLGASSLAGRQLVSIEPRVFVRPTGPCGAEAFQWQRVLSAEQIRTGWCELATEALFDLMHVMNAGVRRDTLEEWVAKFAREAG